MKPVLFSYRAATNDATGYSPYQLEHGIEPILPADIVFGIHDKTPIEYQDYIETIGIRLRKAFEATEKLQFDVATKNLARRGLIRFKPDFKVGDMLYYLTKSSREGRLNEPGKDGLPIKIPEKLQNPWQGPYKMISWGTSPNRVILQIGSKQQEADVTRVQKHHCWTEGIIDTDTWGRKMMEKPLETSIQITHLRAGMLIVFKTKKSANYNALFGVGKILRIQEDQTDLIFQWIGNPSNNTRGTFRPCWGSHTDAKYYYANAKQHRNHFPYTSDLDDIQIDSSDIIASGFQILDYTGHLTSATIEQLKKHEHTRDLFQDN